MQHSRKFILNPVEHCRSFARCCHTHNKFNELFIHLFNKFIFNIFNDVDLIMMLVLLQKKRIFFIKKKMKDQREIHLSLYKTKSKR